MVPPLPQSLNETEEVAAAIASAPLRPTLSIDWTDIQQAGVSWEHAGLARRGPTLAECRLVHAVARLALHPLITNIQARDRSVVQTLQIRAAAFKCCLMGTAGHCTSGWQLLAAASIVALHSDSYTCGGC